MADKNVRTHTHVSNRAKSKAHGRQQDSQRKVVFKSVLDSPFHIAWPSVPINVQNAALAMTIKLAEGVSEYRQARGVASRKRKRATKSAQVNNETPSKKRRVEASVAMVVDSPDHPTAVSSDTQLEPGNSRDQCTTAQAPPSIFQHLTIGINEVTRRLEVQIKSARRRVTLSDTDPVSSDVSSSDPPPINLIFVCRADVDPPVLIDHLPHLVAAWNSSQKESSVKPGKILKLVPLPKGAESALAEAMGLRRVAAIALDSNAPDVSAFDSLLESVPTLAASWLLPSRQSAAKVVCGIVPTHIKQLRTSAPKDMKAAKEARMRGRSAAKEKAKLKSRRVVISSSVLAPTPASAAPAV